MSRRLGKIVAATLFLVSVAACGGGRSAVVEQLDERAGMTLARSRTPLVFARTEPRYSRSARDYLYVGPLEINRQGVREYYLWVGVASTLDRGFIAPDAELPQALYATVDGEPMELPLKPLADLVRRTNPAPIYGTAVPVRMELAARVTLQQLALLDTGLETIAATGPQGPERIYVRWAEGTGFGAFLARVAQR
jgi:hypothetical protein